MPIMTELARVQCCIPFCRRGRTQRVDAEFMCGKHYQSAPKALRKTRSDFLRRMRKAGEITKEEYLTVRARKLDYMLWGMIKDYVMTRAADW